MPKFKSFTDFSNIKDIQTLVKYLSQAFTELQPLLNGKIEFDKNIQSQTVTTFFNAANVDTEIQHSLGKSDVNYIVINKTAAAGIYHGSKQDTLNRLYLRSTVAGVTVSLIVI